MPDIEKENVEDNSTADKGHTDSNWDTDFK